MIQTKREIKELREQVSDFQLSSVSACSLGSNSINTCILNNSPQSESVAPPSLQIVEEDDDTFSTITVTSSVLANSNKATILSPPSTDFGEVDFSVLNVNINEESFLYQTLAIPLLSPSASYCGSMSWNEPMQVENSKNHDGDTIRPSTSLQQSLLLQPLFECHHHASFQHELDTGNVANFPLEYSSRWRNGHHEVGGIEDLFMNV